MKVLVTGGAGFIGSHIVDALVKEGSEVVIVDDLSNGSTVNVNSAAKLIPISILSEELGRVFMEEKPDVVIHEAAQTSVTRSLRDPVFDAKVNILGSVNLLEQCVAFGVKKIIYASSCAAYGTPLSVPLDESHPLQALSPYGVSKQTVERYLFTFQETYGLQYCALRYANVFGPRQNPAGEGGVVAIFLGQMLKGEQPVIFGKGDKSRSYVYVSDVVNANLKALHSDRTGIFNIGTDEEILDQRVFEVTSTLCAYDSPPRYADERPGEIRRMCLDYSKASRELKWKPTIPFKRGVYLTFQYLQDSMKALGV